MGLSSRLVTSIESSDDTKSCHFPTPSPRRPLSPLAPDSSSSAAIERASPGGETQMHRAARWRLSRVVATRYGDVDSIVGGIDQAQTAHLLVVAAGVEERNVLTDRGFAHDLVHGSHEPVRGPPDVRQSLDVEFARNQQPPISFPVAQPSRQPLPGIAGFQIARVEVRGTALPEGKRDRSVRFPAVVDSVNPCGPGRVRVIDEPRESFQLLAGGREQREQMCRSVTDDAPKPGSGQIGQMSGGAFEKVHHLDGRVGGHIEPPLAGAVAESAAQSTSPRLELLRGYGARFSAGQGEPDVAPFNSVVVDALDRDGDLLGAGIGDPKLAHLLVVAAGIEERHVMRGAVLAGAHFRDALHGGHESVRGADVGKGEDSKLRCEFQAPHSRSVPQPVRQALVGSCRPRDSGS